MGRLLVGVDISKSTFSAAGLTNEGIEVFLISGPMDATGFASLLEAIRVHCEDFSHVVAVDFPRFNGHQVKPLKWPATGNDLPRKKVTS